jgi:hypothetical protein
MQIEYIYKATAEPDSPEVSIRCRSSMRISNSGDVINLSVLCVSI